MRLFGHPIHPMLVHFPIVLWTATTGAAIAAVFGVTEAERVAAFANGAGLIIALPAMLAGALELRTIDSRSPAMRVATWHMMAMATAWVCFLVAVMASFASGLDRTTAQMAAAASAVVGFLVMAIGGWLGGRLVYEYGIAVKGRAT